MLHISKRFLFDKIKNQKMKFKLNKEVIYHCYYTGKFRGLLIAFVI